MVLLYRELPKNFKNVLKTKQPKQIVVLTGFFVGGQSAEDPYLAVPSEPEPTIAQVLSF